MSKNTEAEALKAEGNKLTQQKNWPAAAKKYEKAAAIDASCAVYWSNLAYCYSKMNLLDEYKTYAKKIVCVDPSFVKGYVRLANAHHRLFEFEDEKDILQKGLEVYPGHADLSNLMANVLQEIASREKFQEVLLTVPDVKPILLGGVSAVSGGERFSDLADHLAAANPSFFGLKRSVLPPISKKYKDLSKVNQGVKNVIESFFNGAVKAKWVLSSGSGALVVEGYLPTDSVPVMIVSLYPPTGFQYESEQNTKYHNILTLEEKRSIGLILMHRLLREHGFNVGKQVHEMVMFGLVTELTKNYNHLNRFKDSVDVRLAFADMAVGRKISGLSDTTEILCCGGNSAIGHLGEEMEAAKYYGEAALVYSELCEGRLFDQHENLGKAQLHAYAGLAFKRDKDFVNSEREYVAALRAEGAEFQRNASNHASHVLGNLMTMYRIVSSEVVCGLKSDEPHNTIQRAHHVLTGLLSVARCLPEGEDTIGLGVHSAMFEGALKAAYKTRHKAFKAILNAVKAPTIDEYHERLFSCQNSRPIDVRMAVPSDKREMQADVLKHQRDIGKSLARETTKKGKGIESGWECNGCNVVSAANVKRCPCHTVCYCSKECQIKHWPTHKVTCPNRKNAKK